MTAIKVFHGLVVPVAAMVGTAAGNLIEHHDVGLTTVCSVGAIVIAGVWKVANWKSEFSKSLMELSVAISDTNKRIDSLQCQKIDAPCLPVKVKHKHHE